MPVTFKNVTIECQQWRDRTHGNTYQATRVYFDGVERIRLPFDGGYERHFDNMAAIAATRLGLLPAGVTYLSRWCRENGVECRSDVRNVTKRQALAWGKPETPGTKP